MFQLNTDNAHNSKCFFTSSVLPSYVNAEQIPLKKRPFTTLSGYPLIHTVDIVLPQEHEAALQQFTGDGPSKFKYAKVHMKLSEVVSGEFFNDYIKTGNIIMLSEGRVGVENTFSLVGGVLRLQVDKATFQRMGLEGKPIQDRGRKHTKTRYGEPLPAIELNLRLPSMVRGKHGFERILWAFNNVMERSVTWLFCNLNGPTNGSGPIYKHAPIVKSVEAKATQMKGIAVPSFPTTLQQEDYDVAIELLEWLALAAADSPRIGSQDNTDSYLCRHPMTTKPTDELEVSPTRDFTRLRLHGLIPARKVQEVYLAALKGSGTGWFTIHAYAFDGSAYTILQKSQHTMTWEYMT